MSEHEPSLELQRGPIAWMARNSIAPNLLMLILLVGGLWTAVTMQKEVFPQFQLDVVEVSVGYPGAAPSEVEQGILRPVEEAVRGVEGIREITSEAEEGRGTVLIELVAGQQRMKAFQDIEQAVSRIRTFPDDIEQPEVRLQSEQQEVMEVGLFGPVDVWTLRQLAEQLRDQLQAHDQITQVELGGVPDYVTHIEIPRQRLREYGLTLPDVADIIQSSSSYWPPGTPSSRYRTKTLDRPKPGWSPQRSPVETLLHPCLWKTTGRRAVRPAEGSAPDAERGRRSSVCVGGR